MAGETNAEDEFPTGQNNLDCIEPNLWLGNLNAARSPKLLMEKKINSILTVNSFPLSGKISDSERFIIKYIEVSDTPHDDLLSKFDEMYQFIESRLASGGVLVHCYCGVSRSATVVLSYIMKKKRMTLKSAFDYVKSKRESIGPNPGFLSQLQLYETMNYSLDKNNVQYKMFRLFMAKELVKNEKILPESCSDVVKCDPSLGSVKSDHAVFKCRKCRRVLAHGSNIIPHSLRAKYSWRSQKWSTNLEKTICQKIYFIEPLAWMENVHCALEGKLLCPNETCKQKLGAFSWITGCICPCGTTVSPGFYLIPSKVDSKLQV